MTDIATLYAAASVVVRLKVDALLRPAKPPQSPDAGKPWGQE